VQLLHMLVLASGERPHGLWNPTIIGVLTVICAVGLFCGSTYLLLGTNLGARLGFLVAAAGLTGFMVLLTTLWLTTPGAATGNSKLDPPVGSTPKWEVLEVVNTPAESKIEAVRELPEKGTAGDLNFITQVKPSIDAAVVPATPVEGQEPPDQPFATIGVSSATDYILDPEGTRYYVDKTENFFFHRARYAAVPLCIARLDEATGLPSQPATCDPLEETHYVVLRYDYGSVRLPVFAYWLSSILLFGLSLLGLHWWEKDERARKRASLAPVPTNA
jgi:hypothetical protein